MVPWTKGRGLKHRARLLALITALSLGEKHLVMTEIPYTANIYNGGMEVGGKEMVLV